jgi:hypothetical protein
MATTSNTGEAKMKNWFTISDQGWKRANAGRHVGHLIREAISNSLDLDEINNIEVNVKPGIVTIQDDSPEGITDVGLVYTVFLTDKEDSHLKRGRKGRGLKELISAANSAMVETIGSTIIFDEMGRREQDNDRKKGTKVTICSDLWTEDKINDAIDYLTRILVPDDVNLFINGVKIFNPDIKKTIKGHLTTTVIIDGIEQTSVEETTVTLRHLREDEATGWIHEMGIPVQKTEADFHVDVAQRIPMNDKRDVVDSEYLKDVFAIILESMVTELEDGELSARWVTTGLSKHSWKLFDKYSQRFARGKKILKKSDSKFANDRAKQKGYELVDISDFDPAIKSALYYLKSTQTYMEEEQEASTRYFVDPPNEEYAKYLEITAFLAKKLMGKDIATKFMRKDGYDGGPCCAEYQIGTATIFYNLESNMDYTKPLTEASFALLCHELAHDKTELHDDEHAVEMARLGGKLAYLFLTNPTMIDDQFGPVKKRKGKTTFITCVDCGTKREVKVQDVHQCKRCVECQKEHKRKRARERRKNNV